jgi:sialidase-1
VVVDVLAVWGAKAASDGTSMGGTASNPTPVADSKTGEILLFFGFANASMEHATHHGTGPVYEYAWFYPDAKQAYVMSSTSMGVSWSKPKTVASLGAQSPLCGVGPAGGHGVQLASGKLLVPGYHIKKCTKLDAEVVEEAHAWISDGGSGATRQWKISAGFGTGVAEQSFVELFPGTRDHRAPMIPLTTSGRAISTTPPVVRATFRVDAPSKCNCTDTPTSSPSGVHKCRRTAVSTDEGLTWGGFWDQAQLPDPGCKGGYTRADQFSAIIVANDDSSGSGVAARVNVTLSLSLDNGMSYPYKHVIWPGSAGYTDACMVSDTVIGVLYENDGCAMDFQTVDIREILPPAKIVGRW